MLEDSDKQLVIGYFYAWLLSIPETCGLPLLETEYESMFCSTQALMFGFLSMMSKKLRFAIVCN